MIELPIDQAMRDLAAGRLKRIKALPKRDPHQFGAEEERTFAGYVGEEMIARLLGVKLLDTYDLDFELGGFTFDVKTISCKFQPRPDYLATVNSSTLDGFRRQDVHEYVFTRVNNELTKGWAVGWAPAEYFFTHARLVEKGSTAFAGLTFEKAHAMVLPISDLYPTDRLVSLAKTAWGA